MSPDLVRRADFPPAVTTPFYDHYEWSVRIVFLLAAGSDNAQLNEQEWNTEYKIAENENVEKWESRQKTKADVGNRLVVESWIGGYVGYRLGMGVVLAVRLKGARLTFHTPLKLPTVVAQPLDTLTTTPKGKGKTEVHQKYKKRRVKHVELGIRVSSIALESQSGTGVNLALSAATPEQQRESIAELRYIFDEADSQ
ncbi:hypothetical protein CBL_08759 [Carabus blaptoides fortunei]